MKELYSFQRFNFEEVNPYVYENGDIEAPLPRSGHRMVVNGSNAYIIGGYNNNIEPEDYDDDIWQESNPIFRELWRFNIISKQWNRILVGQNGIPNTLASHSAVMLDSFLLVYGGTASPFGYSSSNAVNMCHLRSSKWTFIDTEGPCPTPLYGQAICLEGQHLYVVGGTTGFDYCMDVHRLDLKTREWEFLSSIPSSGQEVPVGRYRHEIIHHCGTLLIFGGGTAGEGFSLDVLHTFNIEKRVWTITNTHCDPVLGLFPKRRKCHVLVKFKDKVYIHGGTNENENLGDFWRLDLPSMTWYFINDSTSHSIFFHSGAVAVEDSCLYLFGGVVGPDSERCNKLHRVFLDVPPLKALAWNALEHYCPNIRSVNPINLIEAGVPRNFVEQIKFAVEVG